MADSFEKHMAAGEIMKGRKGKEVQYFFHSVCAFISIANSKTMLNLDP